MQITKNQTKYLLLPFVFCQVNHEISSVCSKLMETAKSCLEANDKYLQSTVKFVHKQSPVCVGGEWLLERSNTTWYFRWSIKIQTNFLKLVKVSIAVLVGQREQPVLISPLKPQLISSEFYISCVFAHLYLL